MFYKLRKNLLAGTLSFEFVSNGQKILDRINTATTFLIKSFVPRDDKNEVELVLPEGMSAADIRVAQHVVTKMSGLELVPVQKGNRERQWIVRRSS